MSVDTDELQDVKVEDLGPKMSKLHIKFKVIDKGEPRVVTSRRDGSTHTVLDATVGDETGTVVVPLWDDSIDQLKIGNVYELKNGFTGLFRRRLRLKISSRSEVEEIEEEIEEVNTDQNMSEEEHGRRRRDYGGGVDLRKGRSRDTSSRKTYGGKEKGRYYGKRKW
ncbi:single-stranded DNA-binding protein [Candidatus Thorarchaeota archaeon]|nr:MAG: single-stranded DNA-binding protein [Candidatus Thorarchaeota archaeon]